MAWAKTACWNDVVGTSTVLNVLAGAASTSASIAVGNYISMTTQVRYAASTAASTLTIDWMGVNNNGTSTTDTTGFASVQMTGVNAAVTKQSYTHFIGSMDGVAIKVKNDDATDSASIWISSMFGTG